MKIYITGVAGFIGFHLCEFLLNHNYEIYGIDNLNDYYDVELKKERLKRLRVKSNFTFKKIDLKSNEKLQKSLFEFKPKIIINLAAQAGVRYAEKNPSAYVDSNIIGYINLLSISSKLNIEKFIYASSSSVYSGLTKVPFKETNILPDPLNFYAETKIINERLAKMYSKNFGMKIVGLRFFSAYGPFGRPDMAYFDFSKKLLKKEPITLFNKGEMSRDMTHVRDIVQGIYLAMNKQIKAGSHEIFNLGNSSPITTNYLLEYLQKKLDLKGNLIHLESNNEMKTTFADISRSKKELGYNPKVSFEEGMSEFIYWLKDFYR